MKLPKRIAAESGRYSLVDGIPFRLPVESHHSPALMAAFTVDAAQAAALLADGDTGDPAGERRSLILAGGGMCVAYLAMALLGATGLRAAGR